MPTRQLLPSALVRHKHVEVVEVGAPQHIASLLCTTPHKLHAPPLLLLQSLFLQPEDLTHSKREGEVKHWRLPPQANLTAAAKAAFATATAVTVAAAAATTVTAS